MCGVGTHGSIMTRSPCVTHVHRVLVDKGFDAVLCIKINMLIACVRSHLMQFTEV